MLDRPHVVHYTATSSVAVLVETADTYEYRPELGWRWLQRLAFFVLRTIGARHLAKQTVWTRSAEQNDQLVKRLFRQEDELIERLYERDDLVVYIGLEESDELLAMVEGLGMRPVGFSGRMKVSRGRAQYEWRDIAVMVVPWLKGAMIVPRI